MKRHITIQIAATLDDDGNVTLWDRDGHSINTVGYKRVNQEIDTSLTAWFDWARIQTEQLPTTARRDGCDAWSRKIDSWLRVIRQRKSRPAGSPNKHTWGQQYKTPPKRWGEAVVRMRLSLRARTRTSLASPWQRWADGVARNANGRIKAKGRN